MFTLSGRFLDDGQNLFQDFWSPFSIFFICFSARNYFKKKSTDLTESCPTRTPTRPAFKARGAEPPQPTSPQTLAPLPPPLHAAAASAACRRPPPAARRRPRRRPVAASPTRRRQPPPPSVFATKPISFFETLDLIFFIRSVFSVGLFIQRTFVRKFILTNAVRP